MIEKNNQDPYMKTLQNLNKFYNSIDPIQLSNNKLNIKIKSFNKFSKMIKNKPKYKNLFEKVKSSLNKIQYENYNAKLFEYDLIFDIRNQHIHTKEFTELFDLIQGFENLSDRIRKLGNTKLLELLNLVKIKKNEFINAMLSKYEDQIKSNNKNKLKELNKEVLSFIEKYSKLVTNMNKKEENNNSINFIIQRLSKLYKEIQNSFTTKELVSLNTENNKQTVNSLRTKINNLRNKPTFSTNKHKKDFQQIADQIFKLFSYKIDLAIGFLDTLGETTKITKNINNAIVNNVFLNEDKKLAKNIRELYDLYKELCTNVNYSIYLSDKQLKPQLNQIEFKINEYIKKLEEKRKFVIYKN